MGVFNFENNINLIQEKQNYNTLENDEFYKECIAENELYIDNNKKILKINFYLKKSHHKLIIAKVNYDYDGNAFVDSYCLFCETKNKYIWHECHHILYLMKYYSEGLIEGSLSINEIEALFNQELEKKRKAYLETIKKQNLLFIDKLEQKLSVKEQNLIYKKASIIPNFECISRDGIEYETKVDLKIKLSKTYIIKDICQFIQLINANDMHEYGKNSIFKHNIENFDESSKEFINLLVNYCYNSQWNEVRKKEISPLVTQKMIEAYKEKSILINGETYIVSLEAYEPKLFIKDNKICLKNQESLSLITGNEYDMIAFEGYLYKLKCDNELRYLIRFIINNDIFNFESVKEEFSKRIIARFVDEIDLDDTFKEEFCIKDLKIETFIDYETDEKGNINENVIEVKNKYYLEDIEVNEKEIKENNFISKKYIKHNSIIKDLGFECNKLSDLKLIGRFLTSDLENLKKYCTIYLSSNIKDLKVKKLNSVAVNVSYNTGMLDVCFQNFNFSDEELYKIMKALRKKAKFVRLSKNVIFEIDDTTSSQLLNIVDEFNLKENKLSESQKVPLYQGLKLMNDENLNTFGKVNIDSTVKNMIKDIACYKEAKHTIPVEVKDVLREYQVNAYYWLKTLVKYNFCGILADDMGLGKTLEIITLILSDTSNKPSLIVCPKSLIYNWKMEFQKWANKINAIVVNGNVDERRKVLKSIDSTKKDIYITSYDSLKNDLNLYKDINFRFCILDEAQFIKNNLTLKAKSVKQINSEIRFALTGTPIENTVLDLWSLFDFLMPNYLYNYKTFKEEYENPIINKNNKSSVKKLVKKITPFILRRTKKEVLKDLPSKIETIRYASMNEEQRKIYEAQLLKTRMTLETKSKFMVLSDITRLRQLCVHPKMVVDDYEGDSCKVSLVMELLEDLIINDHKVLIFSQFTSIFTLIENELAKRKIDYFVLTGQTPSLLRIQMADEFNKSNSKQKVFLISLRAGGTGLNLVGADKVIQLDPWWNVSAENQASDRAHRIGQKNIVQVIKIICENSIEQKVLELQNAKKDIIEQVISDNDENIIKLSDSDIRYLLN